MPVKPGRLPLFAVLLFLAVFALTGCQRPLIQVAIVSEASSALVSASGQHPDPAAPTPRPARRTPTPAARPTPLRLSTPATVPPDRLVIPAIGLDAPVTPTGWTNGADGHAVWQTPSDSVGLLQGSALPGNGGNIVLSGHHNLGSKVFARLHELAPGDAVELHAGGRLYRYAVEDAFILPERGVPEAQRIQNARWIGPTSDERVTLVTCWPATDNSHRVIIVARPLGE